MAQQGTDTSCPESRDGKVERIKVRNPSPTLCTCTKEACGPVAKH